MKGRSRSCSLVLVVSLFFATLFSPHAAGAFTPLFHARIDYAAGRHPSSVAVGDFSGNGSLHLAVANLGSNTVSVPRNNFGPLHEPGGPEPGEPSELGHERFGCPAVGLGSRAQC